MNEKLISAFLGLFLAISSAMALIVMNECTKLQVQLADCEKFSSGDYYKDRSIALQQEIDRLKARGCK